jgi:hypothetical protein
MPVDKCKFTLKDIEPQLIEDVDKYIKTTIANSVKRYYKKQNRHRKYQIVFYSYEECIEEIGYEENFTDICARYIDIDGHRIPVYNQSLFKALFELSSIQRNVLLRNVVLKTPMAQIAKDFGISQRMIQRHKHNAIDKVRRSMKKYE